MFLLTVQNIYHMKKLEIRKACLLTVQNLDHMTINISHDYLGIRFLKYSLCPVIYM